MEKLRMLLSQFKFEKFRKLRKIVSLIIVEQGYYGSLRQIGLQWKRPWGVNRMTVFGLSALPVLYFIWPSYVYCSSFALLNFKKICSVLFEDDCKTIMLHKEIDIFHYIDFNQTQTYL